MRINHTHSYYSNKIHFTFLNPLLPPKVPGDAVVNVVYVDVLEVGEARCSTQVGSTQVDSTQVE